MQIIYYEFGFMKWKIQTFTLIVSCVEFRISTIFTPKITCICHFEYKLRQMNKIILNKPAINLCIVHHSFIP